MGQEERWNTFVTSGRVEDYLSYCSCCRSDKQESNSEGYTPENVVEDRDSERFCNCYRNDY